MMGVSLSRSGGKSETQPRKSLKSRSSLNLLKVSRTLSNATRRSHPLQVPVAAIVAEDEEAKLDSTDDVPPPTTRQWSPHPSFVFPSKDTEQELQSPPSSGSPSTPTRLFTPLDNDNYGASTPESEDSRTCTPALSLTPKILLPQPSMLPRDSPTKYGLGVTRATPSPDRRLTKAQREKMTGPGLFAHSVRQLKAYNVVHEPEPARSAFSRSSPCLSSSGKQQEPAASPSAWSTRPVTGQSFQNLLLAGHADRYRVFHALPMQLSQMDCFHQHDGWHAAAKPRHNMVHPVSCAICDGYGEPIEGYETAGDDFQRCNWCWVIVCGKCYDVFLQGGLSAMMDRQFGAPDRGALAALSIM